MKKQVVVHLTTHSKNRFNERTEYAYEEYEQLALKAFKHGYEFSRFKEPFATCLAGLCHQGGRYLAKVYDNHIYIFNNAYGHRLLTIYPVPDEYLPIEQYLYPKAETARCIIALVDKETNEQYYWGEYGGLTKDIDEVLEFRTQVQATNYLNNNYELDSYKDFYDLLIV